MPMFSDARPHWAALMLLISVGFAAVGCSRAKYRMQADEEAYNAIGEKNCDPRWCTPEYDIEIDPRSRYYDVYDPDRSPMPMDDPVSHQYMHCVDGMKGWKHWHDNGVRPELENPGWRIALAGYVPETDEGAIELNLDTALDMAYVHSPNNQSQLETLYLSALDVTGERFRLDTQFFGGYGARYVHNGSLIPSALRYSPTLGRWVINPPIDGAGVENNRLTVGRPSAAVPAALARKRLATSGELLAGFANSFVFEFTGGDANLATSLANFSFIQPLLRGAGRDIALEDLTFAERTLLANLRAYSQFRQGFYTQIAIGELGVTGPQRVGPGTNLQSFSGQGDVGGFLGLLRQLQEIRNTEDNLRLQLRTLARLEALLDVGVIDLVQVDQFRQNIENERARLLIIRNNLELALDRYKTNTIGLPPDLAVALDDSLIRQFQLVPRESSAIQDSIVALQSRVGQLPDDPTFEEVEQLVSDALQLIEPIRRQFDDVQQDISRMDETALVREQSMTTEEREAFAYDREQLVSGLSDLEQEFDTAITEMDALIEGLTQETPSASARNLVVWVARILRIAERLVLIPARARLEAVTVDSIDLPPEDAFQIALANRLDFMNGRAALVDTWRLIQVNADSLQSILDVTASGDVRTAKNNPTSFRASTSNVRLGLEFDAPLTRLLERNAYRESLIAYQRDRRAFIQSRDRLHLGLRALLRNLEQLRDNLEIQRRAVTIAIRQVDSTQAELSAPVRPPQPGQRAAQFNPNTSFNLLTAQSSLRDSQNRFLGAWLSYYATKLRLYRELGIMAIDSDGRWIEFPLPGASQLELLESDGFDPPLPDEGPVWQLEPLPPAIPTSWIELLSELPVESDGVAESRDDPPSTFAPGPESDLPPIPSLDEEFVD